MVRIEGLSWDEENEEHIAEHSVKLEEVYQAVQDIRYCRRHRGYLLVLGVTESGRYLTVILDDEGEGIWYPVTARPTSESERRLLKRTTKARGRSK